VILAQERTRSRLSLTRSSNGSGATPAVILGADYGRGECKFRRAGVSEASLDGTVLEPIRPGVSEMIGGWSRKFAGTQPEHDVDFTQRVTILEPAGDRLPL
jgi:hypothetical protein